jgi:hypothetical protein
MNPPVMELMGEEISHAALDCLAGSLGRSLPWVAVERRALQRMLERLRPRAIAIASDQHRIGRLVTQTAAQFGIPVTVLQHGLPQSELGYLPVVAQRVAVWSSEAADWFAARGTDRSRLAVLGNPRFDAIAAHTGYRPARDSRPARHEPRLLLALSPASVTTNGLVVSLALGLLKELPTARLVVKLHPGYREWGWVSQTVREAGESRRVRIARSEDLLALVEWADVALVHRSTVALESLVAGTPVVVLQSDAPTVADIELARIHLPQASSPRELAALITHLLDTESRRAWFASRLQRITEAAGPLDGRAADRIAAVLMQDATA